MNSVRPINNSETINKKQALDLLNDHVKKSCCLKNKKMQHVKITNSQFSKSYSYHYESFKSTYKTYWEENYTEGSDRGLFGGDPKSKAKGTAWGVEPTEKFVNETKTAVVPNSVPTICSYCKDGKIRKILKVRVTFETQSSTLYHTSENIPTSFLRKSKGKQIFYDENLNGFVKPVENFHVESIVKESKDIYDHNVKYYSNIFTISTRILATKHSIYEYPVHKFDYELADRSFYVIGNEQYLHAPNYPSHCCSIL
ncbi:unnamed protein product [Brachionus calyciflorus]|uniref:Uncharacterized protein n=1 Tax=Brachionus calyciflorus TaxID=104777 RepID=A0A814QDC9_9BILA|nr:unnamed protein product [Brachionus calyciflorus]